MDKDLSLFEHVDNIKGSKIPLNKLSAKSKKTFEIYMINRFLSMNTNYIDLVNELQLVTLKLDKFEMSKLYNSIIPRGKSYDKFIKNSKIKIYSEELLQIISKYYECNNREASEYIDTFYKIGRECDIIDILTMFGKTEKEIKKIIGIKK